MANFKSEIITIDTPVINYELDSTEINCQCSPDLN